MNDVINAPPTTFFSRENLRVSFNYLDPLFLRAIEALPPDRWDVRGEGNLSLADFAGILLAQSHGEEGELEVRGGPAKPTGINLHGPWYVARLLLPGADGVLVLQDAIFYWYHGHTGFTEVYRDGWDITLCGPKLDCWKTHTGAKLIRE